MDDGSWRSKGITGSTGFGSLDGIVLPTWSHLWFIVYLWVYTTLLASILALLPKSVRGIAQRGWNRFFGPIALLVVPIAWLFAVRLWLHPLFAETHALSDDWAAHAVYYPAFLMGWAMAESPSIWNTLARVRCPAIALALITGVAFVGTEYAFEGEKWSQSLLLIARLARSVFAWATIIALLSLADRWRDRDGPWRHTLNEAIFPFYLIHQTIIVGAQYAIQPLRMGAFIEFGIVAAATVFGCWLFYAAGRRIDWLRPLMGLKRTRDTRGVIPERGRSNDAKTKTVRPAATMAKHDMARLRALDCAPPTVGEHGAYMAAP